MSKNSNLLHLPASPLTLHIALATYPKNGITDYVNAIKEFYNNAEEDIRGNYAKRTDTDYCRYAPLVYHLFGSYDVACISLIDNHKFAQKLFSPDNGPQSPNIFQLITGICPEDQNRKLRDVFVTLRNDNGECIYRYVGICNLKLSNTFLIGNGQQFLSRVINLINNAIEANPKEPKVEFMLMQSFSWFEVSLVLFCNQSQRIADIIIDLREKKISDLFTENADNQQLKDFIKQSLGDSFYGESDKKKLLEHSHIFADTHSYFGVAFNQFTDENVSIANEFFTEIQWQVKPGHIGDLKKELEGLKDTDTPIFELNNPLFLTGKNDYFIKEKTSDTSTLNTSKKLFTLFTKPNNTIQQYIRGVKTQVQFMVDPKVLLPSNEAETGILNLQEKLQQLAVLPKEINEVRNNLKRLKVSREIKEKIVKIFYNYNNGIQDPVLFLYFLDFTALIHQLLKIVEEEAWILSELQLSTQASKKYNAKGVSNLEKIFQQYIDVFNEGHQNRILNCYLFEEIYDFDLDFNSSLQQLLTTCNSVVMEATVALQGDEKNKYKRGQVVQLNLGNTISNDISINYSIHHLTSPEFIFFTLDKEILNSLNKHDKKINALEKFIDGIALLNENNPISTWHREKKFIATYAILDSYRYITVCNYDFSLFEYWFWAYSFQNPSLYNSKGYFDEFHFHKELLRLIFVACLFRGSAYAERLKCPLPELASLWVRYFNISLKAVIELLKNKKYEGEEKFEYRSIAEAMKKLLFNTMFRDLDSEGAKAQDDDNGMVSISFTHEDISAVFNDNDQEVYSSEKILEQLQKHNIAFLQHKYRRSLLNEFFSKTKGGNIPLYSEVVKKYKIKGATYLYATMHAYLRTVYQLNLGSSTQPNTNFENGKMNVLRRNWQTGEPMKKFIQSDREKYLYSIDPLGGIFLTNAGKKEQFYKIRNNILQCLWDFGMVVKKDLICTYTTTNEK